MQHSHPFDPTYGLDGPALRAITPPPEPSGFDAFWRDTAAAARAIPLRMSAEPASSPSPHHTMSIVRFDGLGGHRHGAWVLLPRGKASLGLVVGHGYGGRDAPDCPEADEAVIYPCAPGFGLSAAAGLPNTSNEHVIHGLAARDTYLVRFCVAGLWAAVSALQELRPEIAQRIVYLGGSFGGGLGALAIPWDARIRRAALDVPTFGHHPWRLRCPCVGSGEAVRVWHAAHPEATEVLAFYDAATAATRIAIPVISAPARFDPAVPPPGQFAVANAIRGGVSVERQAGHQAWPGEITENDAIWRRFKSFVRDLA